MSDLQTPTSKPPFNFERTVCSCAECIKPCHVMPGMLVPEDLQPIACKLGGDTTILLDKLVASEGAKVGVVREGKLVQFNIPTLVPATKPDGSCVFLENDRCTIHEVSPFGCRFFDSHMDRQTGNQRMRAGLISVGNAHTEGHNEYSVMWAWLRSKGRNATPLAERQAALRATGF